MQKLVYIILLCFAGSLSYASVLCPKTFNYIDLGMTIAQVKQACGPPNKITKSERQIFAEEPVTIAVYHSSNLSVSNPTLTIEYARNKIISMKLGGAEISSTTVCGERISTATDYGTILIVCGEPSFMDHATRKVLQGSGKVQVWTYIPNEFQAAITFEFVNGVLTKTNN